LLFKSRLLIILERATTANISKYVLHILIKKKKRFFYLLDRLVLRRFCEIIRKEYLPRSLLKTIYTGVTPNANVTLTDYLFEKVIYKHK